MTVSLLINKRELKPAEEMVREGLARWSMQRYEAWRDRIMYELCEPVHSPFPVVGFNQRGQPLIECDSLPEAIAVPDVCIVRTRDLGKARGFRFQRVEVKIFKAGS